MNKFFFALLILAFFVFEVKSDWDDYISPKMMEKINKLIKYLKDNGLWDTLLSMLRKYDDDYVIQWCTQYDTYAVCEALIDDYLDY